MNESNVKLGVLIVVTVILVWCIPIVAAENTTSAANLTNLTPASATYPSEPYYITIDPIGNVTQGDVFIIHGTTNVPSTETLTGYIMLNEYYPWGDPYSEKHLCLLPNISIISTSSGTNLWSVNTTDCWSDLLIDDGSPYMIKIRLVDTSAYSHDVNDAHQVFTILFPPNATHTSTLATSTFTQIPVQTSVISSSTPTQFSPVTPALPIVAIATFAGILLVFRKKGD